MEDLYNSEMVEVQPTDSNSFGNQSPFAKVEYVYLASMDALIEQHKKDIEKNLALIENEEYKAYWSKHVYGMVKNPEDESEWYMALDRVRELVIYPTSLFKKNRVSTDSIGFQIKNKKMSLVFHKNQINRIKEDMIKEKELIKELRQFKAKVLADNKAAKA